jgi:hypothetical protein
LGGSGGSVPGAVGGVSVNPAVAHVEVLHDPREVGCVARAIRAGLHFDRIVGPGAGVLQIPDIVPERAESERVLDVVPGHTAKGVLADQSRNDDSHGRKG